MQHLLGHLDVIEGTKILASCLHQVGLVRILLIEAREFFDVAGNGRVGELLLELFEGDDDFLKLVAHDGSLYTRGNNEGGVDVSTRECGAPRSVRS